MTLKSALFNVKYQCFRRSAFVSYYERKRSQYWSEDQWRNYHAEKQKELVLRAFRETAFYNKLYRDAGFQPGDCEHDSFFERLPVLTKEHLRASFDELVNPALRATLGVSTTGGSTGVPVRCGYDKSLAVEAYVWRMLEWWGLNPWDHGGYVWRNPRGTGLSNIANQMLWWPTQKIRLDASAMTPESMRSFIRRWNRLKPPQLQGYVGAVDELARFIETNRIEIHKPKVIWVTSAPLLLVQRNLIERVFGAPVYDQYGCCELSWIAAQCEQRKGLHVNAERAYVEFVDEANRNVEKGVWGRTLLTRYDDFTFPLIRYEVGDTGRYLTENCPCGRTLPVIDQVKGRMTDMIRLPSGRVLSGEYLTTIFDDHPDAVCGFRVTQRRDLSICVEYVPSKEKQYDGVFSDAEKTLRLKVADEVPVIFKSVHSIPHERGKLRFVVREL